jgi:hypothetical protein
MCCFFCGKEINDGSRFCPYCGKGLTAESNVPPAPVPYQGQDPGLNAGGYPAQGTSQAAGQQQGGRYVTPNILLCADGKYRWMYELSMFKNPTIFITLCKVIGITLGIMFVFCAIMGLVSGDGLEGFLAQMKMFLIIVAIMIGLVLISYPIAVLIMGGKYVVFFEMDEKRVVHIQAPRQFSKAQALGVMGMLAGAVTGNLSTFALGTYVSAVQSMSSTWSDVKSVKSAPGRNVIYVNELLFKNQVYAANEDFMFVDNFIRSHCPNARLS